MQQFRLQALISRFRHHCGLCQTMWAPHASIAGNGGTDNKFRQHHLRAGEGYNWVQRAAQRTRGHATHQGAQTCFGYHLEPNTTMVPMTLASQ